jgi:hypothetical protein
MEFFKISSASHQDEGGLMKRSLLVSALLFVLLTPLAFGQALTSLGGVVTDPSGAVIPGATITMINTQTGVQKETISNEEGRYGFPQIAPGTYTLTAKMTGFTTVEIKNVQLLVNSPATINVKFEKVGGLSETVTVEAAALQVNTTDASLGNAIGTQAIIELPFFARNVVNLLQLQPGVTVDGQVSGGKNDQANVTLDGVDVNDQINRAAFTSILRVTLDSVQEFRTTTTNSNADSGRGSGADVALVTKAGTNDFHGSLYEYNRNTLFAAGTFFDNRTLAPVYYGSGSGRGNPCTAEQLANEWDKCKAPRAALNLNFFGASVGGPIFKNRLFFFTNYEGRRDASASAVSRTVPTETLRQGIVLYHDTTGALRQLSAAQVKDLADPLHIGPNPASLKIFNMYPKGNSDACTNCDLMNFMSFRFNAPRHRKEDTYIARLDYTVDSAGKHQLFARGNLQNDHYGGTPQFPGQEASSSTLANNKGLAVGWTFTLRPNLIATARYGYTRQGGETTGLLGSNWTSFRNFDTIYPTTGATKRTVPVHNPNVDFAWMLGAHDLRFGATFRFISNISDRNTNSYHNGVTNASGLAGSGAELYANIPGGLRTGDVLSYTYGMAALLGLVSQGTSRYNYLVDGKILPLGAMVNRNLAVNEYEIYGQDSWKVRHNFTITAGIRYSIMPPVHEANGQQISTEKPLGEWLNERGKLAAQGLSQTGAGEVTYVLASSPQGRPMYPEHRNWSPRLGIAYSPSGNSGILKALFGPSGKSSIRAGFGMYYDLIGMPLANMFSGNMFGLSTSIGNPLNTLDASAAPRFTDFWSMPAALIMEAPKGGFPTKHPYIFQITNSIDDSLKAPYTMNINFSWGREFAKGLFIQGSYVSRLSRRSLIQRDLAMPTNLKDPKSGMTYFQAMTQLGMYTDLQGIPYQNLPAIPYFENLWANAAGGGFTATQNIGNFYKRSSNKGDFTNVLQAMDFTCLTTGTTFRTDGRVRYLGCSTLGQYPMFSPQFSALAGWSSIGSGAYHGAQVTVRKRFTENLTFDLNYTYSKSYDLGSGGESSGSFSGGFVTNSWDTSQQYGWSSYDSRHSVNAFGIWKLPFGRGMRFGANMNRFLDAVIGGWQLSGTYRHNSGTPWSPSTGNVWPTNWQLSNPAMADGKPMPQTEIQKNALAINGSSGPNMFASPAESLSHFRQTFPGEYGTRGALRQPGYFNIDLGLYKSFKMPYNEGHAIQIRWETYNISNTVVFSGGSGSMTNTGQWGVISGQSNSPRQMQFAFRYSF